MSVATDPTFRSARCSECNGALSGGALSGVCARCSLQGALQVRSARADLPEIFGNYMLLDKLGEGGMGTVYLARQIGGIERVVALKRIREGELASPESRRRFLADAKHAAEVEHAHVVPIYDAGEHDDQLYFTMKRMSGGTLEGALSRFEEPRAAAALVVKLARAVHACHEKRILHRDLKPENILFDELGEPYVADFGIAKRLDPEGRALTTAPAGTVHYMAPEQDAGHPTVASDVWSLGVILYELLAKRRPFTGSTPRDVLRAAAADEPEPPGKSVSLVLSTVCLTCLCKEPRGRDPLAERDPGRAQGRWLAGMASVGHTELAVIVQTRLEDATALDIRPLRVLAAWSTGGAALLFAGLFAVLRGRRSALLSPRG